MDLLGVTEMSVERTWKVSAGEVKPGRCHRHPSLASPLRVLLFHITHDFYQYDLMFLKNFCTRHWVGPRKSASNRAPHLLRRPWSYPRPRSFTSTIPIIMTWWPIKNYCVRHWVGPRKSASNRAPHFLRPALVHRSYIWNSLNGLLCRISFGIIAKQTQPTTVQSQLHLAIWTASCAILKL